MDPFGEIHVYQPANHPPVSVLILISGDGGWEHAVLKMAKVLSGEGCLVAGVDINQYLKNLEKESGDCASPATDFIALGRSVQEKYGIKKGGRPYLVGYSSGATLVYAAIVQAQPSILLQHSALDFVLIFLSRNLYAREKIWNGMQDPKKRRSYFGRQKIFRFHG